MSESNNRFAAFSDGELVVLRQVVNSPVVDSLCYIQDPKSHRKVTRLCDVYKSELFKEVDRECATRKIDPYRCTVKVIETVMKPVEEAVTKDIE